ncbi:MAG: DUF362 domain-containing protein [Planctomycetota bacterium]|jgi:uncharacterized protein (DUF362 family)
MKRRINRRSFLRTTVSTGASLALFPAVSTGEEIPATQEKRSRVVEVYAPGIVTNNTPHPGRLQEMVDRGLLELTGCDDLASAWSCFIKPDDVVGIKINSWFGHRLISSKKAIFDSVVRGVRMAGVPENRIILWDQLEEVLLKYVRRNKIQNKEGGLRIKGCTSRLTREHYDEKVLSEGFETEPIEFSWGKLRLAELLVNEITAIINLPVLKDHDTAGISGAMKNVSHAVVDKPWRCHDNFCNPYIADILGTPGVRNKLRLHILDAVQGIAAGGPELKSLNHLLEQERLLLSTDPVAVDSIGREWVVKTRKEKGFPLFDEDMDRAEGMKGTPAAYIATAAKKGLGTDDPEKMDLVKVELPAEKKG